MTQIIIATLALTLVHIWFVPAFFNRVHLKYLLGSRDEELELSVGAARAGRAATNFQESLAYACASMARSSRGVSGVLRRGDQPRAFFCLDCVSCGAASNGCAASVAYCHGHLNHP